MPRPAGVGETRSRRRLAQEPTRRPIGVGTGRPFPAKKKGGGFSVGGFFKNVASDVQDTIYGTPSALKEIGEAGLEIAKVTQVPVIAARAALGKRPFDEDFKETKQLASGVAKSYAETYGPTAKALAKGDLRKAGRAFAKALYEDGFFVASDVLTAASAGTAALAKAPIVGSKVATAGKATKLSTGAGSVEKALSSKPFRGNLQRAARATGKAVIPPGTPGVGEFSQAGRVIARQTQRAMERNVRAVAPAQRAVQKLRGPEAVAAVLIRDLPLRKDLDRYVGQLRARGTPEALSAVEVITKPRVLKLYANPNRRVQRAADQLGVVAQENARVLGGFLDEKAAAQRPFLHTLLARGATFEFEPAALAKAGLTLDEVAGKGFKGIARTRDGKIVRLEDLPKRLAPPPGFGSVDEAIDSIRAELRAAGRPEPVYTPDTSEWGEPLTVQAGRGGGSAQAGANLLRSGGAQDLGVLFTSGQRIIDPQPLLNKYLWNTKQGHYLDIHNELLKHAKEVDVVPKGYEVVRRPARPFLKEAQEGDFRFVGRSPERIPYEQKTRNDFDRWLRETLPADNPFTTQVAEEAVRGAGGGVLVVPKALADGLKGEFTRMGKFAFYLQRYPVKVWRAIVLNLRPAWLVNNMIGNSLLYAVSNMDAKGMLALNEMFKSRYPKQARQFDRIMNEHFARQQTGTFIGTQRPEYSGARRATRVLTKLVGSLADVDRWFEQGLRRASVKAEMKRNPALRSAVKGMRGETRDFWQAARKALDDDPVLVQQIENRVNDALGNFSSLSRFERDVMRSAFPFWAWYRAIVGVTLKLPVDQPVKYALLTRATQVGVEESLAQMGVDRDEIPPFLRGFIPTGPAEGDRMPGVSTASANPFSTVDQMGKFAAALGMYAAGQGKAGDLGRALPGANPFFMNLAEGVFGTDVRGASTEGEPPLYGIYADLPPVRLAEAFGVNADPFNEPYQGTASKPRLYDQDPRDQLLRFLGVPYARVSKQRARQMAKEGR